MIELARRSIARAIERMEDNPTDDDRSIAHDEATDAWSIMGWSHGWSSLSWDLSNLLMVEANDWEVVSIMRDMQRRIA